MQTLRVVVVTVVETEVDVRLLVVRVVEVRVDVVVVVVEGG